MTKAAILDASALLPGSEDVVPLLDGATISTPETVRDAVFETLTLIGAQPERAGKKLVGRLEGLWSARVGNYRVLYTVRAGGVIVRAIRHRAVAHRRRRG